jgi:hypothetical protein
MTCIYTVRLKIISRLFVLLLFENEMHYFNKYKISLYSTGAIVYKIIVFEQLKLRVACMRII